MSEIGKASIRITPSFDGFTTALRVIAKHATACADELDGTSTRNATPECHDPTHAALVAEYIRERTRRYRNQG